MKFYIDRYGDLLTEGMFENRYLDFDSITQAFTDGHFADEFITICLDHSKERTIEEMFNYFMEELKEDKNMFSEYLEYWDIKEKEIPDEEVIKALKEG